MRMRVSVKLVLCALVVAFGFALVPVVSAQPGEFVKGVLQPLADGFPKRPITLVVIDDPGSRDDLYAKSLQAALKGISPVSINVVCEPSAVGGTWYTVNEVPSRDGGKEGYYLLCFTSFGVVTDLFIDPGTKEIGATLDQAKGVTSTDLMPYVWVQRKNAPWGRSFKDLTNYGKANPNKLRYISYEVGSGHDLTAEIFMQQLGMKVQKIPQGSLQEACSTVGAGEGDFTVTDLATAIANMNAGRVDVIMVLGDYVSDMFKKSNPQVVSAKEAGMPTFVTGTMLGWVVPAMVPQSHIDWLSKLLIAGANTDLHKKRLQVYPGMTIAPMDAKEMDAVHKQIYKNSEGPIKAIGLHIDQQKK